MVAGTFDLTVSTRTLYLDGDPVANSNPETHSANSAPFTMGDSSVFCGRYFQGRMDEVAIFDRSLSAAEINAFYKAASPFLFTDGFE